MVHRSDNAMLESPRIQGDTKSVSKFSHGTTALQRQQKYTNNTTTNDNNLKSVKSTFTWIMSLNEINNVINFEIRQIRYGLVW